MSSSKKGVIDMYLEDDGSFAISQLFDKELYDLAAEGGYQDCILLVQIAFSSRAHFYRVSGRNRYVPEVWDCVSVDVDRRGLVELTEEKVRDCRIDSSITDEMIDQFCRDYYGPGITEVNPTTALWVAEELAKTTGSSMWQRVAAIRDLVGKETAYPA